MSLGHEGFAMLKHWAVLGLLFLAFIAPPLVAQPPAPEPLPEGARLRLGNTGLNLGGNVQGAALSPDGKYLAAASQNTIALLDLKTGKRLAQIGGNGMPLGFPLQIAFSPTGKIMAYASIRNVVLVDIPTGKQLQQLDVNEPNFFRGKDLTFSADGKVVAVGMEQAGGKQKNRAFAWNVATGKPLGIFEVAQNAGCSTALSPDGKILATWGRHFARMIGEDQTAGQLVQLWDLATAKELRAIKIDRPNTLVAAAVFAPNGKTLTVACGNSSFHVFDTASGKEVRNFAGRRGNVVILRYAADGKTLAAGSHDGTVQAWNAAGKRLELPAGPKARLLSFAFPKEGQILALGMLGQTLAWWDATSGKAGSATAGHQTPVLAVTFAADGKTLASASIDGRVVYWDASSGRILRQLTLTDDETIRAMGIGGQRFNMLALSPDGRFAATNSIYSGSSIRLWDLATGQVACDFEASRQSGSYGLAFTRKGNRLAAASMMKLINIWDTEAGQEVAKITYTMQGNNPGGVPRVALSPDGKLLALLVSTFDPQTGTPGTKITLLDAVSGKDLHSHNVPAVTNFNTFGSGVQFGSSVAFSDDSKFVALPGPNQTVLVLRAASGREYKRLETTAGFADINGLAFSPDGRTVAVAHGGQRGASSVPVVGPETSALEICELVSGKSRVLFKGQQGRIYCLAFSPDGATVAAGSSDTTVVLWDLAGRHGQKAVVLNAGELEAAWAQLMKLEGAGAFAAQRKLIASPAETVAFLKQHLTPATPPKVDPKKIAQWVADLDSESFETRDEAYRSLDRLGAVAEAALRKARAGKISLEMRRRLDDLVEKLERGVLTPAEVQAARAVEVLERIATPDACTVLAACADGMGTATLTIEAHKALGRMKK
jgi:WD40 repeat protein